MRIALILLACLFLPACALTTDYIDVPYERAGTPSKVTGADAVEIAVKAIDARATYRDRVSSKKNGYGAEMAPIVATNDVIATVEKAIETELEARGFVVAPTGRVISVEVMRFYNDFRVGFFAGDAVAEVTLHVKVLDNGGQPVFTKYFAATGKEPDIQLAAGHNARPALIRALQNAVSAVINDEGLIRALLQPVRPPTA